MFAPRHEGLRPSPLVVIPNPARCCRGMAVRLACHGQGPAVAFGRCFCRARSDLSGRCVLPFVVIPKRFQRGICFCVFGVQLVLSLLAAASATEWRFTSQNISSCRAPHPREVFPQSSAILHRFFPRFLLTPQCHRIILRADWTGRLEDFPVRLRVRDYFTVFAIPNLIGKDKDFTIPRRMRSRLTAIAQFRAKVKLREATARIRSCIRFAALQRWLC